MQTTLTKMRIEASIVELARMEKRAVSASNRGVGSMLSRMSKDSRKAVLGEVASNKKLARRSGDEWLKILDSLPYSLAERLAYIIWWDYAPEGLDKYMKGHVDDFDEDVIAYNLYLLGYTASKALTRAKPNEVQ